MSPWLSFLSHAAIARMNESAQIVLILGSERRSACKQTTGHRDAVIRRCRLVPFFSLLVLEPHALVDFHAQ